MGQSLAVPITEKVVEAGSSADMHYAISAIQGWRVSMEDSHCCCLPFSSETPDWFYFAVFDGHAGKNASIYCSTYLLPKIREKFAQLTEKPLTDDELNNNVELDPEIPREIQHLSAAIHESFIMIDDEMKLKPDFRDETFSSGTTALVLVVTPSHLVFGNCGDSRAILTRDGSVIFKTKDHKPQDDSERVRIIKAGSSVITGRVDGNLAVSRAIGDFSFKTNASLSTIEQAVSPEPTISVVTRHPDDNFAVLACDGVWDVMDNDQVSEFILNRLRVTDNVLEISKCLIDACLYKDSKDNMTAIIIVFPGAPKVDPGLREKDKEIEEIIKSEMEKIISAEKSEHSAYPLIKKLSSNDLFPDEYTLYSKISFVVDLLDQLKPERDRTKDYSTGCIQMVPNSQLFFKQVAARYNACYLNNEDP
ncbi:Protein phosphatase 1B [Thelohanellus kitauei]|uniref:Protein phosphatase 1B n=1 Tax=Thelohanellus kitauei TaxID=669202 RepID=A0A0C2MEE1_THEKT|nr:Protein phosphatase 1B [Thelohanellus kitauei]